VNSEQHNFESFLPDKSDDENNSSVENDVCRIVEPPSTYDLIKWAIEHNVPNNSFDSVLKILKLINVLVIFQLLVGLYLKHIQKFHMKNQLK